MKRKSKKRKTKLNDLVVDFSPKKKKKSEKWRF